MSGPKVIYVTSEALTGVAQLIHVSHDDVCVGDLAKKAAAELGFFRENGQPLPAAWLALRRIPVVVGEVPTAAETRAAVPLQNICSLSDVPALANAWFRLDVLVPSDLRCKCGQEGWLASMQGHE